MAPPVAERLLSTPELRGGFLSYPQRTEIGVRFKQPRKIDVVIVELASGPSRYMFDIHHYGATPAPVAGRGGAYLVSIYASSLEEVKRMVEEHPMFLPQRFAFRDIDGAWSLV